MEPLEIRWLLTVDLAVVQLDLNGSLNITEEPGNVLKSSLGILVETQNTGSTPVDLANGTPEDESDDVLIRFFVSADSVFDAGDQQIGEQNLAAVLSPATTINPGGSREVTFIESLILAPGTNFVIVVLDPTNELVEDNEANNIQSLDVRGPVVNTTGADSTVTGRKPIRADSAVGLFDGDTPNWNGGQVQTEILSPETGDHLVLLKSGKGATRLRLAGGNLKLGRQTIGVVTGNKSAALTVQFTADINRLIVQQVLRNVGFRGLEDNPAARTVRFRVRDPSLVLSNPADKIINFD